MSQDAAARAQFLKMTTTPVPKLVCRLAGPTIVSMMVSALYNMADTFFVAKLGTSAAGAVGIVFSLMAIIQAVGFMFGMGAGSIVSRRLGEEKNEEASCATSTAFFTASAVGVLIALLGLTHLDQLMYFLGATDTILPYSKSYASYILYGAPIMCASFVMNTNLRAEGKSIFAMIGIGTGGVLNILLDPLFIFTFDMGIAGAAIATLISQCVSFGILLSHFIFHRSVLRISPRRMSHNPRLYLEIVKTGLPSLLRQGLSSAATIALNTSAALYGDAAVAAMSIVTRVVIFIASAILGFGQGFQPVAGYNYGAKRYDRVLRAFWFTLKTETAILLVLTMIGFFGADWIIGSFQRSDPQVLAIGIFALRAQCFTLVTHALITVSNMTFQSLGMARQATLIAAARQGLFFFPCIYLLPRFLGLTGIQISQSVADVLTAIYTVPLLVAFLKELNQLAKQSGSPSAQQLEAQAQD